jgi:hypothetical protein
MQYELTAHGAFERRSTQQREQLLLEVAVQGPELGHRRSPAPQLVLDGREKQALEGRRVRS